MKPHIFIKVGKNYIRVSLDDLVYIKEIQEGVTINLIKGQYKTTLSLQKVSVKLPAGSFCKISSDCLVASKHIISCDCESVTLTGCKTLPVEEKYQDILALVTNLLVTPLLQ